MMTLQQIKYFLEVARTQKFTSAAKNLFVAQSSLSYAIHELERELGVPLFVRNLNKKVVLTEYGEKYLPYAEQIFEILKKGEEELRGMKDPLSGTVKLGFFYCVSNSEIPRIFRQFYADNPKCDIFLDFSVNQGLGLIDEQLQLGTYDMIISTSSSVSECESANIGRQKLYVLLADNHHLAGREKISLKDLDGEPILCLNPNSNLDLWIREMFNRESMKPDISYCPDWMTQFGYVAMNYGVAITPSMPLYRDYTVEKELDNDMVWRDLFLHWPKNRKLTKSAEFVRDYMIEYSKTHNLDL